MRTVVEGLHPTIVATTENGTPASGIRVQPVCLKSWNRQLTPALAFADSHVQ